MPIEFNKSLSVKKQGADGLATPRPGRIAWFLKQFVLFLVGLHIATYFFKNLTAIEEISFYGSLTAAIIWLILKREKFFFSTPFNLSFALFVLWAFTGLFFAVNKPNSIHDFYAHLLKYMALFYIISTFFCSPKKFLLLTWIIIACASLFSIGGIIYFYFILGQPWTDRFLMIEKIFIEYHDYLIVFAFMLIMSHFSMKPGPWARIMLYTCTVALSSAILLTQTRSAMLGFVLSLLIFFHKRKAIYVLLFVLILFSFLFPFKERIGNFHNIVHNERIPTIRVFLEMIKERPVTGMGFGMRTLSDPKLLALYDGRLPKKDRDPLRVPSPHNTFIDVTARTGLVGLSLYLLILATYFKAGISVARKARNAFLKRWAVGLMAAFVSFLIQSMFTDTGFGRQALVFYLNLGMIAILWKLDRATQSLKPAFPSPKDPV